MPATTVCLKEVSPEEARSRFVETATAGGLLVFPTDTVYGLGARADDAAAVKRIFRVKGRGEEVPLPVLIGSLADLPWVVAEWPPAAEQLARRFWPGALTMVLPRHPALSPLVTGGRDTVGVRRPDHPELCSWLSACRFPLAVTSANLSGEREAVRCEELHLRLREAADVLFDGGACPGGRPSTVVDLTGEEPQIRREGPVPAEEVLACLRGTRRKR